MRTLAAAAALAAALPATPALATHEIGYAVCAYGGQVDPECEYGLTVGWALAPCSAVVGASTADGRVVTLLNGYGYFPQAAEVRTVCWIGGATAIFTVPGKVGGIGAAVRVHPNVAGQVCTRWEVRSEPGNTFGFDPDVFYPTRDFCTS